MHSIPSTNNTIAACLLGRIKRLVGRDYDVAPALFFPRGQAVADADRAMQRFAGRQVDRFLFHGLP